MPEYFSNAQNISTNVRNNNPWRKCFQYILGFSWKYAPGLSKAMVKKLFFSPTAYRTRPLESEYLNNGNAFSIRVNGARIQCWQWGSGPAVLLAHGWNGRGIQLHPFIKPANGYRTNCVR